MPSQTQDQCELSMRHMVYAVKQQDNMNCFIKISKCLNLLRPFQHLRCHSFQSHKLQAFQTLTEGRKVSSASIFSNDLATNFGGGNQ